MNFMKRQATMGLKLGASHSRRENRDGHGSPAHVTKIGAQPAVLVLGRRAGAFLIVSFLCD
jgi:hypothetical protein